MPIANESIEVQGKIGDVELAEPFVSAIKAKKYEILWMEQKKTHSFYCVSYYSHGISREWSFEDVLMDTSRRDAQGKVTDVLLTYHPSISLVNIPFMVLPAPEE